jgi:hypothetical protein
MAAGHPGDDDMEDMISGGHTQEALLCTRHLRIVADRASQTLPRVAATGCWFFVPHRPLSRQVRHASARRSRISADVISAADGDTVYHGFSPSMWTCQG